MLPEQPKSNVGYGIQLTTAAEVQTVLVEPFIVRNWVEPIAVRIKVDEYFVERLNKPGARFDRLVV